MKIAYFVHEEWEKEYFVTRFPDDEFVFYSGSTKDHADVGDPDAEVVSFFVDSPFRKEEMERFPSLKLIATRSTGYDHIDMLEAKRRGLVVVNVPTYGVHTVAEYAFALILALSRRVPEAVVRVRNERSFQQQHLRGFDLLGKTIGIIGVGHIGEYAVRMAKGFGMNIIAFDVFPRESIAEELGFRYVSFDEVLASSDIISLHVPYNTHTHHLMNRDAMTKIKKGAVLINTSRGGLVETQALVEALESGRLSGAGLDVLEEENSMKEFNISKIENTESEKLKILLANQYLMSHPNVIITPHVAFNTKEAIERILGTTAGNLSEYKKGNLTNVVEAQ